MRSKTIWYVLGAIGLVIVGFLVGSLLGSGWLLHTPDTVRWGDGCFIPATRPWGGHMTSMGGGLFWGWPLLILFSLGPIAGIVALIIVLVNRKPQSTQTTHQEQEKE